jgi:ribosomal protein L11 methylase PrmA
MVWDLGANTGVFSQVAAGQGRKVIAFDIDPAAVEKCYQDLREKGEKNILPLVMDFTNPSPNLGWQNRERDALLERGPAGAVLALALVHHLAIGNNVPLGQVADFLAACGPFLIIEFVPKSDSQVRKLLATREDIFPDYTPAGFEAAFSRRFETLDRKSIPGSERTLYLMTRRAAAT